MGSINRPYNRKTICSIADDTILKKHMLQEMPNKAIAQLILKSLLAVDREEKMCLFQRLTNAILNEFGGFNIDGFKFKSKTTSNPSES